MPSKGRPQIGTRISHELYAEMMEMIAAANQYRKGEPYSVCSFVETAIAEKIAKMKRSRGVKGGGATRYPTRAEEDFIV
jgi:hypothetical protein